MMQQPKISRYIFRVSHKEKLTPHYIRIKLQSDEDIDFDQCTLGANNKIFIPPKGVSEVHFPEFDETKGEWVHPSEELKPIVRTYTHRAIDPVTKEITIDFVNHGDNGPASAWAAKAKVGQQLGVAMKIRPTIHYQDSDWYFLIGDATAIPVICCILESLPPTAKGCCLIEVPTEKDIHPEVQHAGFDIQWLINPHPEHASVLSELAKEVTIPLEGSCFAYVACEYTTVKILRHYFRDELKWTNKQFYAYSYWKAGDAEDQTATERRQEKAS